MATYPPPVCLQCRRYRKYAPRTCDAFKSLIPRAIWLGGNPHTSPVKGDYGLLFVDGEPQKKDTGKPARYLPPL
jgi:hypothetical protein